MSKFKTEVNLISSTFSTVGPQAYSLEFYLTRKINITNTVFDGLTFLNQASYLVNDNKTPTLLFIKNV